MIIVQIEPELSINLTDFVCVKLPSTSLIHIKSEIFLSKSGFKEPMCIRCRSTPEEVTRIIGEAIRAHNLQDKVRVV